MYPNSRVRDFIIVLFCFVFGHSYFIETISDSEGAELSRSQAFLRELSIRERHLQKYTQLVRYNDASLSCTILVEFIEEKFRRIIVY